MKNKIMFCVILKLKFSGHVQKFFVTSVNRAEAYRAALSLAEQGNLGTIDRLVSIKEST